MLNKSELVAKIAEKSGLSKKDAGVAFDALLATVTESLVAGEEVNLTGVGKFEVSERAERKGRNPKTNEEIVIPASKYPNFRVSKTLKDAVKA